MSYVANKNRNTLIRINRRTKFVLLSFGMMRSAVGILGLSVGILLPAVTAVLSNCLIIQDSISIYYYTLAGDVFVGLLSAIGFFLIAYPGEGRWEDIWTNIAGICSLGIAFFPTAVSERRLQCEQKIYHYPEWVSIAHLCFAAAFFLILGGIAFWTFPKTNKRHPITNRLNVTAKCYRLCGLIIWLCILVLFPLLMTFPWVDVYEKFLLNNKIIFLIEVIALMAFGISWLLKGIAKESSS